MNVYAVILPLYGLPNDFLTLLEYLTAVLELKWLSFISMQTIGHGGDGFSHVLFLQYNISSGHTLRQDSGLLLFYQLGRHTHLSKNSETFFALPSIYGLQFMQTAIHLSCFALVSTIYSV